MGGTPLVRDFRLIVLKNDEKLRAEIIDPLYRAAFQSREEENSIANYFGKRTFQLDVSADRVFKIPKYSAATYA
jgi:hypothetical protein